MFKKLQIHLVLICSISTSIILILASFISLYVIEKEEYENEYNSFINTSDSTYYYLQSQDTLSYDWIYNTEINNNCILYIEDNGQPLKISNIGITKKEKNLIKGIKECAEKKYAFYLSTTVHNNDDVHTIAFSYEDKNSNNYIVSASTINKYNNTLGTIIIYPLDNYYNQTIQRRIIIIVIDIISIILLTIFSYVFSSKAIKPIKENRDNQNKFIASASHELRTPLSVILSSCTAIQKGNKDEQDKFLSTIISESNRMDRLINDMLLLASTKSHSWTLNMNYENLDTILLDVYESFDILASSKGFNLEIDLPDIDIPKYKCDKERIMQVLLIFINNSINHSNKGGTIKLILSYINNCIHLHIIDNGIGISDENKKHLFEAFYRCDNSRNNNNNFGLGLSIAYEIVKLHKGTITVSDTPGGGTTFKISLPL